MSASRVLMGRRRKASRHEIAVGHENYEVIEPRTDSTVDGIVLGHFATEREAALVYDRAMILLYGDDAETNFPPEESEHVVFSDEVMQQINALKAGWGRVQ